MAHGEPVRETRKLSDVATLDFARECERMAHRIGSEAPAHLTVGARIEWVRRELGMNWNEARRAIRAAWYGEAGSRTYADIRPRYDAWQSARRRADRDANMAGLLTMMEALRAIDPELYREPIAAVLALAQPDGGPTGRSGGQD